MPNGTEFPVRQTDVGHSPGGFWSRSGVVSGMADILAENLSGKTVVGSDGRELGQLYNITMDVTAGALRELIVEPEENRDRVSDIPLDDEGRYRINVDRVQAVTDHVVVSR